MTGLGVETVVRCGHRRVEQREEFIADCSLRVTETNGDHLECSHDIKPGGLQKLRLPCRQQLGIERFAHVLLLKSRKRKRELHDRLGFGECERLLFPLLNGPELEQCPRGKADKAVLVGEAAQRKIERLRIRRVIGIFETVPQRSQFTRPRVAHRRRRGGAFLAVVKTRNRPL